MPFAFEKLEVYRESVDFADSVTELTGPFPRGSQPARDQDEHDQQPEKIGEPFHRSGVSLAGSAAPQCPSSGLAMAFRISVSLSTLRNLT